MTKYKLTEKAIAEKFDMLSGFTINMFIPAETEEE